MKTNRRFMLMGSIIIFLLILLLPVTSEGFFNFLNTFIHRSDSLPQVTLSYLDYDGAPNSINLNVSGYSLENKNENVDKKKREITEAFAGLGQIPGPEKILTDNTELSFKITNVREPEEMYIFCWPETILEGLDGSGIDLKSSSIPVEFEEKYKRFANKIEGKINISKGFLYGIRLVWGEDRLEYNFHVLVKP